MWDKVRKEIAEALKGRWVWLIFNGDKQTAGRITARENNNGFHFTLYMEPVCAKTPDSFKTLYHSPLCGYVCMADNGDDIINRGIAEILKNSKDALLKHYGVTVNPAEWYLPSHWTRAFESAGYWVNQAV